MTEPGTNHFPIYVTDDEGVPVTTAAISGFSAYGYVSTNPITLEGVTNKGNGFYIADIDIPQAGQGYLRVIHNNGAYTLSPEFYPLEIDNYDSDSLYAKLTAIGIANIPEGSPTRYGVVNITVKQDASIDENVQIPSRYLPLTNYTNFSFQMFPPAKLTVASTPPISGSYACTVINATSGLVNIIAENNVLQNLIPEGSASVNLYGDIVALDPNGRQKRMVEVNVNLRRDFNNNI
jgi:hypothetical protein